MLCPECNRSFDGDTGSCPNCGALKGIVKTSTILISAGDERSVYRSVEEVPDLLKGQLIRSTHGLNSATLVIADRQGRKEIAKAIRSLPAPASEPESGRVTAPYGAALRIYLPQIVGVLLLLAAGALVWFLFR